MKKVLVLAMLVLIAVSVPASAAYKVNWISGFEATHYTAGQLSPAYPNIGPANTGQFGWFTPDNANFPSGTARPQVEAPLLVTPGVGVDGTQGLLMQTGANAICAGAKDFRTHNVNQAPYYMGYMKTAVWDPGWDTTLGVADARVGLYSPTGTGSSSNMVTAQIQDGAVLAGQYWKVQWRWNNFFLDGSDPADAAGITWTPGPAAPRVYNAWSTVKIQWSYTYNQLKNPASGGVGTIKWFINNDTLEPNMTLTIDSAGSTSFATMNSVAGMWLGAGQTIAPNNRPVVFDNVEFHANALPEPSSLLALGTGALGLLGLIRRRK